MPTATITGADNLWVFLSILILVFSFFLLLAGIFTAYFGSGKSRKIGAGLLAGGLVIGLLWVVAIGAQDMAGDISLGSVIWQTFLVLVAATIGAALAIGLFLLAIMKS